MKGFILIASIVMALAGGALASEPAAPPPFASEISQFDVEDEIFPPPSCATLFVGSSSIRLWFRLSDAFPEKTIIRRGFGGSAIADANYYFDRLVARYRPKEVVFYAGENDINAGTSPESTLAEFKTFMKKKSAALGDTPVYFISIKPSKARIGDLAAQTRANELISAFADSRADLVYVDVVSRMMKDGQPKDIFIRDGLHMTSVGYDIWRDALDDAFKTARITHAPHCK